MQPDNLSIRILTVDVESDGKSRSNHSENGQYSTCKTNSKRLRVQMQADPVQAVLRARSNGSRQNSSSGHTCVTCSPLPQTGNVHT